MKKKQRLTIWDLGRVPVTEVAREKSVGTLADYRRLLEEEERQAEAAKQARFAEAQAETGRILSEINVAQKELTKQVWGMSLEKLSDPQVRQQDNAFDEFVGLADERYANQTVEAAFGEFLDNSIPLTGYALTEDGMKRLCWFGVSHHNRGKDLSTPEAWAKAFDRLLDCGAFAYGETVFHEGAKTIVAQPRVEEPVEQPRRDTFEDLEAIDPSTREGLRRAQNIAENLYVEEMIPVATAWVTSIQRHYGFSPTSEDMRRVSDWIERNNLNRLAPQTYDAGRRWLVSSGYWPESCLMETEKFNLSLEAIDTSRLTVAQRNDLNRRELQAREADAARFGQ